MSHRHFDSRDNAEPRAKIDEAKRLFPPPLTHESHECHQYRQSHKYPSVSSVSAFHKSPVSLVSPVSEGQGLNVELGKELQGLAACNACTRSGDRAESKRFKLARDVRAVEVRLGRQLDINEVTLICSAWFNCSQPFLEQGDTFEDHLAAFLAELGKVRFPTGEGATLTEAVENVSKLSFSELPEIPGIPGRRRIGAES
jgi:hypothetical protein